MAACDISIELDAPPDPELYVPVLRAGEPLMGAVVVRVDEPVQCNGLDIELRQERHDHTVGGKTKGGRYVHEKHAKQRLFEGHWEPGTHRYPFSIEVPPRPSYDGIRASWSWLVFVAADIPWAFDPKDFERFRVAAPVESHDAIVYEPLEADVTGGAPFVESLKKYGMGFFTMPVFGLMAAMMIHAAFDIEGTNEPLVVGLPAAAELLMVYIFWRARKREREQLGPELELRVERSPTDYRAAGQNRPGVTLRGVATSRGAPAVVEYVDVDFRVLEETAEVTSSSEGGDNHCALWTTLWEEERRLDYDPDGVYRFELSLPAPGSVPFSTGRDDRGRGVYWRVMLRVVCQDGRDERATCEIDVRPATSA